MGWFDESDDDESDKKDSKQIEKEQNKSDVGEEVDPLDAYMASLSSNDETKNANKTSKPKVERLDYENEEEATSHWTITSTSNPGGNNTVSGGKYNDSAGTVPPMEENPSSLGVASIYTHSSTVVKEAAKSLSSTFHRAGVAPTTTHTMPGSLTMNKTKRAAANDLDAYDSDSNTDLAPQKKQKDTIEPLPAINHSEIHYEPFRRTFYDPHTNLCDKSISASSWRTEHSISVTTSSTDSTLPHPPSLTPLITPFKSTPLSNILPDAIVKYLTNNNLQKPTLVQAQTLPIALAGHDIIVTASTGSGKTFAYLLPMVVHCLDQPHIVPNQDGPIGIILVPTRELAAQIYNHASKLMKKVGGNVISVTGGGRGRYELSKELKKGCEIVVSTPGRLIDMLKGRDDKAATNLRRVTMVVLDEADRMLEMGFESQVGSILRNVRPDRHTMMLSATFGRRVEKVAEGWLKNPVRIAIGKTGTSSSHVTQHIISLPSPASKLTWLISIIPTLVSLGKMIIFVASRVECERVTESIRQKFSSDNNIKIESIHGDKHQHDRNAALRQFEKGRVQALIATDVASRGLDVKDVMTVINFDVAKNIDIHVHRIGRAGRMSASTTSDTINEEETYQKGMAYTLMTKKDADFANLLLEHFEKEGRNIENELKDLARYSKYFGRSRSGAGPKKQIHGIGWNRDEFQHSAETVSGHGRIERDENTTSQNAGYYGPASSSFGSNATNARGKNNLSQSAKRKRWG